MGRIGRPGDGIPDEGAGGIPVTGGEAAGVETTVGVGAPGSGGRGRDRLGEPLFRAQAGKGREG